MDSYYFWEARIILSCFDPLQDWNFIWSKKQKRNDLVFVKDKNTLLLFHILYSSISQIKIHFHSSFVIKDRIKINIVWTLKRNWISDQWPGNNERCCELFYI